MPRGYELANQFAALAQTTSEEEGQLRALSAEITATRAEIDPLCAEAASELAAIYLPELSREALALAEKRSGFRGFTRFDPIKAMDKEHHRLEHDLAALRADERYVRREYLVGPVGTITRRLTEAISLLEPWQVECARFESLPSFEDLVASGYDTDHFDKRWWEPSYWRLWAAGDAVCAALGLADFGDDVLPAYELVRAPRDQWRAQVAAISAERAQVLELVRRHDSDTDRLAHLPEIYLSEAQQALAQHLGTADAGLLEQWSEGDRAVVLAVRKLAGRLAKTKHLKDLEQGVTQWAQTLEERRRQYQQKAGKYRAGKKGSRWYDDTAWSNKPAIAIAKSAQRRQKLRGQIGRIRRYDNYERFDLSRNEPELWWFEFTGSAPPVWSPGLRSWYQRNPSVAVAWDDDDDRAADAIASTVVAHQLDGLGDLS